MVYYNTISEQPDSLFDFEGKMHFVLDASFN